ncbi:MAG: twin-arginine translocation signal domain-containing protein [Verrucomicrobiota bacterium]
MSTHSPVSRRGFMKASLLASAAVPLSLNAQPSAAPAAPTPGTAVAKETLPLGKIAGQEFSRMMLGGNLISGWSHSRDLGYVSALMKHYNTESKIRETLELAEANGINAINTYVQDNNTSIFNHWKNGGKMKWFAQVRLDPKKGYSQINRAVDEGAAGVHVNGDAAEGLLNNNEFEKVGEMVELIKSKKRIAGVAAHDLRVIVESVKAGHDVDFYQKTLHTHEYYTAPRADETGALGAHDNSWCSDPKAVVDFMATVKKPWIAFKILAAGAVPPRLGLPYAFSSGADFALVGMFDWQIVENVKLARRFVSLYSGKDSKRTRPWCG